MKVQRSSVYAHFRKAVRFVSVAAVLSSFALGAACARKPGDAPINTANGELAMELQLKKSFPEFDWKAKGNKELAAKLVGASLRLSPVESKDKDVTHVGAQLLVQFSDVPNILHAEQELTSGAAVEMEMMEPSDPAFSIQARCMDKSCDIVAALVSETVTTEGIPSRTAEELSVSGDNSLALSKEDAVKIKPAVALPATDLKKTDEEAAAAKSAEKDQEAAQAEKDSAADAAKADDSAAQADNKPSDVEETSGDAKNATADTKQDDKKPATPEKEPAKAEDKNKNKIVRSVALVFRKRQVDQTMKPEAQKALMESEGNMELLFSSSPNEDFKAGKSKVGVKPTAPSATVTAPAAGEKTPEAAAPATAEGSAAPAAPAAPAEGTGNTVTEVAQSNGSQGFVNTTKQTENLK